MGQKLRDGMGKRGNGLDLAWSWKRKRRCGYGLDYCSTDYWTVGHPRYDTVMAGHMSTVKGFNVEYGHCAVASFHGDMATRQAETRQSAKDR